MRANELRRVFTEFFAQRDHRVVPSASLIPHDPSLLFTVAGMVPFKPYFVGEVPAPYPRAVSVQKCVRAGGKHNDLDEIGRTSRHLSFFEMMGNFSFGDYFKDEAIALAWEFITEVLKLDPDRLWVTVHTSDDEAEKIWTETIGVDASRVQRLDEDNFWRMGATGPCGPCSEIFWDKGEQYGPDGGPKDGGEDRFIEIWNLVFMQYDQRPDGTTEALPKPSIDTGAGLERILSVLQEVDSVWELDEIRRLIAKAEELTGATYGVNGEVDISLRILAEHARTAVFLISDGIVPSNEDRGYVLRRIIRRAVRFAYLLGVSDQVMGSMADEVIDIMAPDYPELLSGADSVRDAIDREERGFRKTLQVGLSLLETELAALNPGEPLSGSVAFQLHDTYGFPLEVTSEVAVEAGTTVDVDGFEAEMSAQRERAKRDRSSKDSASTEALSEQFSVLLEQHGVTDFVGRETPTASSEVLLARGSSVVLDTTPFYAESGGQVGDTGSITTAGGERVGVLDTTYGVAGLVVHQMDNDSCELLFEPGQTVIAEIDAERRSNIARHHTATHLLHWALRKVLGEHVKQQGSWVGPERLRFDFSHFEAITASQMEEIENLVAAEVLSNSGVRHYETTMAEATEAGAIAFFGDKYGDRVRVLEAGNNSVELCGGTHVNALGNIGPLKVLTETSIGSNIRRVEAVVGVGPITRLRTVEGTLAEVAHELGVSTDDVVAAAKRRVMENKALAKELAEAKSASARGAATDLVGDAVDGYIVAQVEVADRNELRDMATSLRDTSGIDAVVLASSPGGKGVAVVGATDPASGLHAGDLISSAVSAVGGGGGKGEHLATAGGRDADAIPEALDLVRQKLSIPPKNNAR